MRAAERLRRAGPTAAGVMAAGLALAPADAAYAPPGSSTEVHGPRASSAGPGQPGCRAAPRRVDLRATGRAPGASGWMELRFGSAPSDVAVTEEGVHVFRLTVSVTSVPPVADGTLVAWAATRDLDEHVRLGRVGEDGAVEGEVAWNKFLVFVTAEPSPGTEQWQGPILLKATSPSGRMHTMAGHGIFQQHGIGC